MMSNVVKDLNRITLILFVSPAYIFLIITPQPLPLTIPITPSPIIQHLNFGVVDATAIREFGGFGAAGGLVVGAAFLQS